MTLRNNNLRRRMKSFLSSLLRVQFVRNVATLQAGQVVTVGCGLLTSILYARLLGLGGYGTYAIVLAFTGLFGFVTNLGQQTVALTFLAEAYGRKDSEAVKRVLHYYITLSLCTVLILIILFPLLPVITEKIYGNPALGKLGQIIFASSMIDPIFVCITVVLQVVREIRLLTLMENARVLTQAGLAVLLLLLGYGVAGVLWGTLLGTTLFAGIGVGLYPSIRRKYDLPSMHDVLRLRQWDHIWRYGRDGIWIALDKNLGNLYPNIFLFVLSTQMQESVVGLFRLAFKLGNLPASLVLTSISRMASSVIPTLAGSGASLRKSLLRLGRYAGGIHLAATAGALLVVPPLIPVVYGADFGIAAYPFYVIATLHLLMALHALITPVLRLFSRIYWATLFNLTAMVAAMTIFFVLQQSMKFTFALYCALGVYHVTAAAIVVPTLRLIRSRQQKQAG